MEMQNISVDNFGKTDGSHYQLEPVYFTHAAALTIFLLVGLLQTFFAYIVFGRTDDHPYFLSIANFGTDAVPVTGVALYDLKALFAGNVFYAVTLPSRLGGGSELLHLVWLRLITLLGFCAAFEWVRLYSNLDQHLKFKELTQSRTLFFCLVLLYPGQLAWSASLLRDGIGCAFLFFSFFLWSKRWRLVSLIFFCASLSLRPEYVFIPFFLLVINWLMKKNWPAFRPKVFLVLLCIIVTALSFEMRYEASQFSIIAFSDAGSSYPAIEDVFDVKGYVLLIFQALLDPLSISNLASISLFQVAEILFFVSTLLIGLSQFKNMTTAQKSIAVTSMLTLWVFAYFELFVSGYSRHRMALMILLLAVVASVSQIEERQIERTLDV